MEKSDSELLKDWDVVSVSSVYESGKDTNAEESSDTNEKAIDIAKISINNQVKDESVMATSEVSSDFDSELKSAPIAESESKKETDSKQVVEVKPDASIKPEPKSETELEPACEPEPEPEPEQNEELESDKEESEIEETVIEAEPKVTSVDQSENVVVIAKDVTELNVKDSNGKSESDAATEQSTEELEQNIDEIVVEDIVHVDKPSINDSSLTEFEIRSCKNSYIEDVPELLSLKTEAELEMASIESSSSDIDIIDENLEESITSSFISPSSLSISSSVADTSSMHSIASQSDIKDPKGEQKTESSEKKDNIYGKYKKEEATSSDHHKKSEKIHTPQRESQRTNNRRSLYDWIMWLIEFFCSLSGYDWCLIGGVAFSFYFTVILNQTNIFEFVQKENVVSQMKDMMDELKHDNKILKEQLLSEVKSDERALSSFEYQIKELRKENSKLSHMLFDVAKVLDKQKDFHEKKEAEYLAPFKMEINKLKEHINTLKFDNEELQKQLVRMRYGSHSQYNKDAGESKDRRRKDDNPQAEKDSSTEEIPLDLESLKKWNELISVLSKELGLLSGADGPNDEKSRSDKDSKPFWKTILNDFKKTFKDLHKVNFSTMFSNYRKANQKAVSDIYKFVKDFFTLEEDVRRDTSDDSQWKNIGDFVKDLQEKWENIKDRMYTSDLKQFFEKRFKKSADESSHREQQSQKPKEDYSGSRTSNHHNAEKKQDNIQTEDTKWMFNRAAHREEQRNVEEEEDVNWYLKKNKYDQQDARDGRHL